MRTRLEIGMWAWIRYKIYTQPTEEHRSSEAQNEKSLEIYLNTHITALKDTILSYHLIQVYCWSTSYFLTTTHSIPTVYPDPTHSNHPRVGSKTRTRNRIHQNVAHTRKRPQCLCTPKPITMGIITVSTLSTVILQRHLRRSNPRTASFANVQASNRVKPEKKRDEREMRAKREEKETDAMQRMTQKSSSKEKSPPLESLASAELSSVTFLVLFMTPAFW